MLSSFSSSFLLRAFIASATNLVLAAPQSGIESAGKVSASDDGGSKGLRSSVLAGDRIMRMPPPDEAVQAASSLALLLLLFDAFFAMVLTLAKALPPPLTAMGPEKDATPRGMATIHSDARREQGRTLITSTWQRQINAVAIAIASASAAGCKVASCKVGQRTTDEHISTSFSDACRPLRSAPGGPPG